MKNILLKTIGKAALGILMLAVFAPIWVSAQDNGIEVQNLEELSDQRGIERDLEGSWNTQVTIRNCETGAAIASFPAMNTFMRGGTMQEFSVGSGLLRGPGHGVWNHQSGRRFSYAFQFFRFNADGTYAGLTRARRQVELSRSGNSYNASATIEIINTGGVVVATACATEVGTRFE